MSHEREDGRETAGCWEADVVCSSVETALSERRVRRHSTPSRQGEETLWLPANYQAKMRAQRIRTHQFAFEEDHPPHFGINAFAQLLLKFFPSIADVGHFNGAPQDHGHKALRGERGVDLSLENQAAP